MSGTSPESTGDHTDTERKDIPRKRSKVSRACDACRRKKVRCDAEFLSTLQKVTKICTNCLRTNDVCTFARVPLKRGPTKGYSRDSADQRIADDSEVVNRSRLGLDLTPFPNILPTNGTAPTVGMLGGIGPHASLSLSLTSTATSSATSISSMLGNYINHLSAAQTNHNRIATPPSPIPQQLVKPLLHRLKFLPSSPAPIILPPLLGTTQAQKINVPLAGPTISPGPLSGSKIPESKDSRIQGPLWKVPYEMPTEPSGLDPMSPSMSLDSRRSSVDSVSSILTAGLRSRLPSLQPLTSLNSDLAMSDSDSEDVYVSRARASISPQNSISSLLSLNGRVGKLLTISANPPNAHSHSHSHSLSVGSIGAFGPMTQPGYSYSTLLTSTIAPSNPHFTHAPYDGQPVLDPASYYSRSGYGGPSYIVHQQPPAVMGAIPPAPQSIQNSPEYNIRTYYSKFQGMFPVLPFEEQRLIQALGDLLRESQQSMLLVQLFYSALNNLVNYQNIPVDCLTSLLHQFLDLYPFEKHGMQATNNAVMVAVAALILINYTILIKGNSYSLAISIAAGLLGDLKILDKFALVCNSTSAYSPDDVQIYLPRLQMCLFIIDDCYSLSFGTQPRVQGDFDLLVKTIPQTFPELFAQLAFVSNLPIAKIFHNLLVLKGKDLTNRTKTKSSILAQSGSVPESSFASLFSTIIKDKYELFDFFVEVLSYMRSLPATKTQDEDVREQIYDFQLKIIRLIRKLSQSVLDFANYISSIYFQTKGQATDISSSPFFNVSYGHSFKLINACKKILDSLINHMNENDIISRLVKINNDLSISYNLLVSNLNNNFHNISNAKNNTYGNSLNRSSSGATLTASPEVPEIGGLGTACILLVTSKLEGYNLSFNNLPSKFDLNANANQTANMSGWNTELSGIYESLILNEDVEGWY
ncbi:hypothetical protein PUMCH_004038 [Australozyma saopauloensis]|uniref:Zn(2)-C6 fungal-type domain-containing protein n=1 Tax=Australozyma saopauloensis TaxID=291208 RepID=A0AAX4HDI3_9ASCO|nr:hypothetical protein PUMCH_004038 [[Candida] saopauloensis]